MKRPFLGIGISIVFGVIFAFYFNIGAYISFLMFLALALGYLFTIIINKNRPYLILLLFFMLGITLTAYHMEKSLLLKNLDRPFDFQAQVERIISQDEEKGKYVISIKRIKSLDFSKNLDEKTMLKIIGPCDLELGDRIEFRGVLKRAMGNTNPNLYNYRNNLLSKKIHTTMTIKKDSLCTISSLNKSFKYRIQIGFRNHVERTFDRYLEDENSELLKGIVLGDHNYLDEEDLKVYRDLGLAHLLAVSGLHIGIIAGALIYLISRIGIKKNINGIITIIILWTYGYLIGMPVSIMRANIMFSTLILAGSIAEPYDSLNALFFSFTILLIYNPLNILSLGFKLSYIASFSIICFSGKVKSYFYPYENKFVSSLSLLLALYTGTLIIQIYYFNKFSPMAIISNIVIAPLIFIVLVLAGALILIQLIASPLGPILGYVVNKSLNLHSFFLDLLHRNNFLTLTLRSPKLGEIILLYTLIFIVMELIDLKYYKEELRKTIYLYLILLLPIIFSIVALDRSIEIDFIDVGQGDACLIKTRGGNYLVDTGGNVFGDYDIGENISLPYLQKQGIKNLEGIFISHFDLDHCKALPLLVENLNVKRVFISYRDPESQIYNYIINTSTPVILLEDGDSFKLDKNTYIDVISPCEDDLGRGLSPNNQSLVFNLIYNDKKLLFTGDIEKEIEGSMIDKLSEDIDLIKIPHHGSISSSTEEFIKKLSPRLAVISVGRNNNFGHPHSDVIHRLESLNTEIYRTDINGMIRVRLDKESLIVKPYLEGDQDIEYNIIYGLMICLYYCLSYILIKRYIFLEKELYRFEIQ